jgi:hypothetical protein
MQLLPLAAAAANAAPAPVPLGAAHGRMAAELQQLLTDSRHLTLHHALRRLHPPCTPSLFQAVDCTAVPCLATALTLHAALPIMQLYPMKRIATPEEVAHAICFLIHPSTTFTTGGRCGCMTEAGGGMGGRLL